MSLAQLKRLRAQAQRDVEKQKKIIASRRGAEKLEAEEKLNISLQAFNTVDSMIKDIEETQKARQKEFIFDLENIVEKSNAYSILNPQNISFMFVTLGLAVSYMFT